MSFPTHWTRLNAWLMPMRPGSRPVGLLAPWVGPAWAMPVRWRTHGGFMLGVGTAARAHSIIHGTTRCAGTYTAAASGTPLFGDWMLPGSAGSSGASSSTTTPSAVPSAPLDSPSSPANSSSESVTATDSPRNPNVEPIVTQNRSPPSSSSGSESLSSGWPPPRIRRRWISYALTRRPLLRGGSHRSACVLHDVARAKGGSTASGTAAVGDHTHPDGSANAWDDGQGVRCVVRTWNPDHTARTRVQATSDSVFGTHSKHVAGSAP